MARLLDEGRGRAPHHYRFLFLLSLVLIGCSEESQAQAVPPTLGGLELHHQLSGARALEAIERLHGGEDIEITDVSIAHYGDDTTAMLYVGTSGKRAEAAELFTAMRDRIADGDTPFREIHDIRLFGADVYMMSGQGQLHFLFQDGRRVVWLSADPPVACPALVEVLAGGDGQVGCGDLTETAG